MRVVLEEVRNSGFVGIVLLFFGLIAIALAAFAVASLVARSRTAALMGAASVCLGALLAFGGTAGTFLGRARVDDAVAGGSVSPVLRERIRRVGYAEARSAARIGLVFAVPALLAGAAAMLLAAARRRQEPARSSVAPHAGDELRPSLGSVAPPGGSGSSAVTPLLLGLAGLSVAGAVAPLLAPLPGRDLAPDDPTWELLQATDEVLRADGEPGAEAAPADVVSLRARCEELEDAARAATARGTGARPDAVAGPDYAAAAGRCVDDGLDRALARAPGDRPEALARLAASPLLLDPARRQRVEEALRVAGEPSGEEAPPEPPP